MSVNRTSIVSVLCLLVMLLCAGCGDSLNMAGPGRSYSWLTDEEWEAEQRRPRTSADLNDDYWKTEHEIEKLKSLNKELELENSLRIKRMQLELKQREAERKLRELNK